MTPREPDRFEAKAREIVDLFVTTGTHVTEMRSSLAVALRTAESSALERAARDFDQEAERLEQDARKLDADGQGMAAAAHFHDARVAEANANRIRALASPAAAPAAETEPACTCGSDTDLHRIECAKLAYLRAPPAGPFPAPPSEPAAPEKVPRPAQMDALGGPICGCGKPSRYESGWCGETNCFNPQPIAPAPLLPRVLAALDIPSVLGNRERLALAAELRAYIAEREPAEKRIAELESAIRWALGEEDHFPPRELEQGQYWWRTELRRRAKLAARAAKGEGR